MSTKTKYTILILALTATATMLLWPNFHPEQAVLGKYYWQADIAIHGGYYFLLALLLLNLKPGIKPILIAISLALFSFALEGLQYFSFKRGVSLLDLGSNVLGITLALTGYISTKKKIANKIIPLQKINAGSRK